MKIDYRNYPVLEKLRNNEFGKIDLSPADVPFFKSAQWKHIYHIWKKNTRYFLDEVNYVSEPLAEAAEKATNRFLDLYKAMLFSKEYDLNFSGTFIEPDGFTYLLRYVYIEKTDCSYQVLYWFVKNRLVGCFYLSDYLEETEMWICEDYKKNHKIDNRQKELHEVTKIIGKLLVLKLFMNCAKVEVKKLPPKSKTIDLEHIYVNETWLKIKILDSLWLTTLVKSDYFNERGHFDVTVYDKKLNDNHLKWIREDKSEYIAPARILKYFKINGG